ncbi:hypothetical protein [Streptomyces longwoodensis]|uniref:hypothetical protein n=1 Tax=Streptomyces longwoodensis TaxID=68231 RepID=UPI003820BCB4
MPTIHREPRFTYDDLVDLVEGQLRVVELTAVNAEIGGPGERLWLSEPGTGADVYRLWRKGKGARTYWAVDQDRPWDALVWLREALAEVLERLTRPGSATRCRSELPAGVRRAALGHVRMNVLKRDGVSSPG